jgi:equilibrative nucleoside transporter 1/2/3
MNYWKQRLLYLNFILLGAGFLMSWNTLINAIDYFTSLFPSRDVEFDIAVSYMIPNVIGCFAATKFANKFSFKFRIIGGFSLFIILLLTVPTIEYIASAESSYATTIIVSVLIGFTDSAVQTAIYGYASLLDTVFIQSVQVGNGVSAVLVSFLRIITKISLSQTPEGSHSPIDCSLHLWWSVFIDSVIDMILRTTNELINLFCDVVNYNVIMHRFVLAEFENGIFSTRPNSCITLS